MAAEKQALAAEKQALEERDAALRAAMKEFDAKVEALAAREAAMEEEKNSDQGGEVPEELKNVAAKVKPFDSTATIRKQIDEQQAVLTSLFHVFDDVDVEDCKFKITQVAKNLLGLEGQHDCHVISGFCETLRRRLPHNADVIMKDGVANMATFNDLVSSVVGCTSLPTFNQLLASLRKMGIAPNSISEAAFGQHARSLMSCSHITYSAIRGISHATRNRTTRVCGFILRGGVKRCPLKPKRGHVVCSRHTKRQRS